MQEIEKIEEFLRAADKTFPVPLSEKQDLHEYAVKLHQFGTLCTVEERGRIVSMVAGYTDNLRDHMAYLSLVGTLKEAQHKGYASRLLEEFMEIAKKKNASALHFYAVESNQNAVRIYRRHGFRDYRPENEPRPNDLHLIYWFGQE